MMVATIVICLAGCVLLAVSIPLARNRVKPNQWYGVRTPATLRDPDLWYAANRYGGRVLAVAGVLILLVGLISVVLPQFTFSLVVFAPALIIVASTALIARKLVVLQRKS